MLDVILKALSLAFIILIGMAVRKSGLAGPEAGEVMKKVLIYITLPASVITGFSGIDKDIAGFSTLFVLIMLGLAAGVIMIIAMAVITRKRPKKEQALMMQCVPSFNIGAFCVPFVGGFIGPAGSAIAYTFDVGNAILSTGGTYAVVSEYTAENKQGHGIRLKPLAYNLLTSPSVLAYIFMLLLAAFGLRLPERVLTFIQPINNANSFVAMLMIGLLFHLELKKEYLSKVFFILGTRFVFAVVLALFCWYVLPFDQMIRETMVLVSFSPVPAAASAYVGMMDADEGMASCAASLSIVMSLIIMTILITVM